MPFYPKILTIDTLSYTMGIPNVGRILHESAPLLFLHFQQKFQILEISKITTSKLPYFLRDPFEHVGHSHVIVLLLENPEAHLHPRGQACLGRLMAKAASSGVQIVVETHSDHVLNGVRVAIHEREAAPEQVRIHFFERPPRSGVPESVVISPNIDSDGRIDKWPQGFFDEWDTALDKLLAPPQ